MSKKRKTERYYAMGQWLTATGWSKHPQCEVSRPCVYARLKRGWTVEDAISKKQRHIPRYVKLAQEKTKGLTIIRAFGEQKTASEWSNDKRCKVGRTTLYQRINLGWNSEEALTLPLKVVREKVEAFGETKTIGEWSKDRRCNVNRSTLYQRVRRGWALEKAMTKPPRSITPA